MHIVREAKPVFDPLNQLDELRSLFKLRTSYAREIAQARDLGWLLDRHGGTLNAHMVVRRMVWCVRTIRYSAARRAWRARVLAAELAATAPLAADLLSMPSTQTGRDNAAAFSAVSDQEGGLRSCRAKRR